MTTRGAPEDARFEQVVRDYFEQSIERDPVWATFLGLHAGDDRLANTGRDGIEERIASARRLLSDLASLDPAGLSPATAFDRELVEHAVRRDLFALDSERVWERRANAMDEIGDGIFAVFARDFAPLEDRLRSIAGRLEDAPRVMKEQETRLGDRPVALWNRLELESAQEIPTLLDDVLAAAQGVWADDSVDRVRLERAADRAKAELEAYRRWLTETIARSDDDFALGRDRYDELVELRAFDGLGTDDILSIGEEQLAAEKAARSAVAREIDRDLPEAQVIERLKSDHPVNFDEALQAYRDVMYRARAHLVDHDLVTLPEGEALSVIETPRYLRNVLPFAAYFDPARFDPKPSGIYMVTPSVNGEPDAIREHNYSSISNTSIHEAYPGHHVQLSAATTHPSLARVLVDAPEFVEGWGMYSEQMMREEGFDTAPRFRLAMHTDAIWRACRIVLDVRLHRGEISVDDAIAMLVRETGFEQPNAAAEVRRYTYTPTYQLSYLLGKVMLLRLREDEKRRLGNDFSLKRFHDALIYAGSLPVSFQRRSLTENRNGGSAADGTDAPVG